MSSIQIDEVAKARALNLVLLISPGNQDLIFQELKTYVVKKCVLFFALFVLAVMAAALIGTDEKVELIEDVSQGEPQKVDLVAHGGGY